jgi:hypothetical protein
MLLFHFLMRIPVVAKCAYYIHVPLSVSVSPPVVVSHLRISMKNFFIKNFYENCRENPNLVKIWRKYRALYMKT